MREKVPGLGGRRGRDARLRLPGPLRLTQIAAPPAEAAVAPEGRRVREVEGEATGVRSPLTTFPSHRGAAECGDPVVITGLGAVTPLGVGVDAYAAGLRAGRSGVRLIGPGELGVNTAGEAHEPLDTTVVAACDGFDALSVLPDADVRRLPRLVPMGLAAAEEACRRAGLATGERLGESAARGVGLVLGTGGGGIDFTLRQADLIHHGQAPSLWTITNATHGNLAGELSIRLGLKGPSLCVSDGCASSSDAVALAMSMLRSDRAHAPRAMVVVGADAHLRWECLKGMELLRVITRRDYRGDAGGAARASRPFDAERDGFVLGEGAWAVVLERASHARAREARPIAEMLGAAATCDAYHRVRPDPSMEESVRAMREAIDDAGLTPTDIEMVHYHGTSTEMNDRLETSAVREAFGEHADRLVGHSVKGAIGHPQGASGLAALVGTVASLTGADGGAPFAPPTINLETPDPACDLDYTANGARATDARTFLVNCLAFGAKNSVLVGRALPSCSPGTRG